MKHQRKFAFLYFVLETIHFRVYMTEHDHSGVKLHTFTRLRAVYIAASSCPTACPPCARATLQQQIPTEQHQHNDNKNYSPRPPLWH